MIGSKFLTLVVCAASSFAVTLTVMSPAKLNADGPQDQPGRYPGAIVNPVHGVSVSVWLPNSAASNRVALIQPGKTLPFKLILVNTLDQTSQIEPTIVISTTPPVSRFSRVSRMPSEVWRSTQTITLAPKETRTIDFSPEIEQAPASNIAIKVKSDGKPIAALQLGVAGDPPKMDGINDVPRPSPSTKPAVAQSELQTVRNGNLLLNK